MDYIFASSVRNVKCRRVVISYDIVCQWYRHFEERCENLPEEIRFDPTAFIVDYVIPKFHIAAHGPNCQCTFSLNY